MKRALSACLAILALAPALQAAPLQNGDFSAGFTGWGGAITDSVTITPTFIDPATDPDHFALPGSGLATLGNDIDYFEVVLFQDFDLPVDAATLSLDFAWSLTNASQDFVQALLIFGPNLSDFVDLLIGQDTLLDSNNGNTGPVDISPYAGMPVTLEFLLQDGDFDENDSFSVGNIVITTAVTTIPVPAPLALLGTGLLALTLVRRKPG